MGKTFRAFAFLFAFLIAAPAAFAQADGIEHFEPVVKAIVEGMGGPTIGSWEFQDGGTSNWASATGLHRGYFTAGQLDLETAGTYRAGVTDAMRERHVIAVNTNALARLSFANKLIAGGPFKWRSWTYELSGRPEGPGPVGPPCIYPFDEPLYGDVKRAAGTLWNVDLGAFKADNHGFPFVGETVVVGGVTRGVVHLSGDEPNHSARYSLHALALNPANKGRWFVQWLGSRIDAQLVARTTLWLVAQNAVDQYRHPWVQQVGVSDRSFARGFSHIVAASLAGQLTPEQEGVGLAFLDGAARKTYEVCPGAALNTGKGDPTLTPPIGVNDPAVQFFGLGLVGATYYDLARVVQTTDPTRAARFDAICFRIGQWIADVQGAAAAPACGYFTLPQSIAGPGAIGKPLPATLAPYVADGTLIRNMGGGTESGKWWTFRSLRCAAKLGNAAAKKLSDDLLVIAKAEMNPEVLGWLADENGNAMVTP